MLAAQRTEANPPLDFYTSQSIAKITFTHVLSPLTSLYAGTRWQRFRSDIGPASDWNEAAVFAGVTYTFR